MQLVGVVCEEYCVVRACTPNVLHRVNSKNYNKYNGRGRTVAWLWYAILDSTMVIYLSDDGNAAMEMSNIYTYEAPRQARSKQLCPPISLIVSAVQTLVDEWKLCCSQQWKK